MRAVKFGETFLAVLLFSSLSTPVLAYNKYVTGNLYISNISTNSITIQISTETANSNNDSFDPSAGFTFAPGSTPSSPYWTNGTFPSPNNGAKNSVSFDVFAVNSAGQQQSICSVKGTFQAGSGQLGTIDTPKVTSQSSQWTCTAKAYGSGSYEGSHNVYNMQLTVADLNSNARQ